MAPSRATKRSPVAKEVASMALEVEQLRAQLQLEAPQG